MPKKIFTNFVIMCMVIFSTVIAEESIKNWTYPILISYLQSDYNKLINRENLLAEDYEPNDLVRVSTKTATSQEIFVRKATEDALIELFKAAESANIKLFVKSGYRSYSTQKTMYRNRLSSMNGVDDKIVAPPGSSEHQSGLAVDIINVDFLGDKRMTQAFGKTNEGKWLVENCAKFGFILRYPKEKENITNIFYEPWHLRYVGTEISNYVMKNDLTHEEFTQEWKNALNEYELNGGSLKMAYEFEKQLNKLQVTETELENGETEVSITTQN